MQQKAVVQSFSCAFNNFHRSLPRLLSTHRAHQLSSPSSPFRPSQVPPSQGFEIFEIVFRDSYSSSKQRWLPPRQKDESAKPKLQPSRYRDLGAAAPTTFPCILLVFTRTVLPTRWTPDGDLRVEYELSSCQVMMLLRRGNVPSDARSFLRLSLVKERLCTTCCSMKRKFN